VLAWKIKTYAIPTRVNISRRGVDIQSLACPICDGGMESSERLFFRCDLSRQIGRKIASWWNVCYADAQSYEEWFTWMASLRLAVKTNALLEGVFYVMWWNIWTYRNKIVFEDKVVVGDTVQGIMCRAPTKVDSSWADDIT
nr:RNA-directed DNA polymerase, eukaryota [Tanacetum cinerariifolium]